MLLPSLKQFAKGLTPPIVWKGAKSLRKKKQTPHEMLPQTNQHSPLPSPLETPAPSILPEPLPSDLPTPQALPSPPPLTWGGERAVKTLAELDREIARADEAGKQSDDELRKVFPQFYFDPDLPATPDPYSDEYREKQFELYRMVSGRKNYNAAEDEKTEFDLEAILKNPFPYCTKSSQTVGDQLIMLGVAIQAMATPPGGSILEFGPGWGNTTIELARMGYAVTAVDINAKFVSLIEARAKQLGLTVDVIQGDMLSYQPNQKFDRVLFYECFHHCSDHIRFVERLDTMVAPNGVVAFAWEPIWDLCPVPWGLRLDGISVWSTRKFGWLELGFRTDYFRDLMGKNGWTVTHHPAPGGFSTGVFLAKRK